MSLLGLDETAVKCLLDREYPGDTKIADDFKQDCTGYRFGPGAESLYCTNFVFVKLGVRIQAA